MAATTSPFDGIKEEALQACSTGDVPKLQSLLASIDTTTSQPPPEFFTTAATSQQPAILTTLFTLFPSAAIPDDTILETCRNGSIAVFTVLLAHNRDILNRELSGSLAQTPFSATLFTCKTAELAMWLLEQGARVNDGGFGPVPTLSLAYTHHGKRLDLLRLMIAKGVNAQESYVLSNAASDNRADWLECLLSAGADANTETYDGSLLAQAVKSGSMDAARVLVKYGADNRGLSTMQKLKFRAFGGGVGKDNTGVEKDEKNDK